MFREVDNIVKLGKWAYYQIPGGIRCKSCPLLGKEGPDGFNHTHYTCGLRQSMALIYDEEGPFKDETCPVKKEEVI